MLTSQTTFLYDENADNHVPTRFSKKTIPSLRYAMLHSDFGLHDGVSIVMQQVHDVMVSQMGVPEKNLFYLVGRCGKRSRNITRAAILRHDHKDNLFMRKYFEQGYGGDRSERIERALTKAQKAIERFVDSKRIDVIIAHNTSLPFNFVLAVALHRFYRDRVQAQARTPKYILWWHDAHTERPSYAKPASDVKRYLLQGVPGPFAEYIVFINSLQFHDAEKYFMELDSLRPGYLEDIRKNHGVIYNTTSTFIDSYGDLIADRFSSRVELFLDEFGVRQLLQEHGLTLKDVQFCLQHTRMVERKRIDFALRYCFALFDHLKKRRSNQTKAFYFLVSGHDADRTKGKLKRLHKRLCKEYGTDRFFLVFAQEYDKKTTIRFDEFPLIFAKLKAFTTYFSEIEGFGNNLLEVLAAGLVPVVYTYPVFKHDIAKYGFKLVALDRFEIQEEDLKRTIEMLEHDHKRKLWVNRNLVILKKHFSHMLVARKLKRAIIRRRTHV